MIYASGARTEAPDVILFNKGGREARLKKLSRGEEVPREFFYGFFDLQKAGIRAAMMPIAGRQAGISGLLADTLERGFARLTALGARPLSAKLLARQIQGAKVLISNTDGFSLSMGLGLSRHRPRPVLIGGFQGLSDIEERSRRFMRPLVKRIIRQALSGLDHVTFLSPADRTVALASYGVDAGKTSLFDFGVDTEFWRPCPDVPQEDFAFAIGQDWNRDFDCLVRTPVRCRIRIISSLPIKRPPGANHVEISPGGFADSQITDRELRRLYNAARVVVVPCKDVYQPTGQSVTLQAMSCGKPVILSRIRGLWAPELLRDGENCLLVPPGDVGALGAAIERIFNNPELAAQLGRAARETAIAHFGLDKLGAAAVRIARLGLKLHAQRQESAL